MAKTWDNQIVERSNWHGHIKGWFQSGDVNCMTNQGIDLQSYYRVRLNAVLGQVLNLELSKVFASRPSSKYQIHNTRPGLCEFVFIFLNFWKKSI